MNRSLESANTHPSVIIGAWQLSAGHSVRPRAEAEVFDALARCADAGYPTFDCADIYTGVEELLGRFRNWYRDRSGAEAAGLLRFHTKLVPDRDALASVSRRWVEETVDRSLRRLGVERLDLVQFAWWDYEVSGFVELGQWVDEQRAAGKVRSVGATNFDAARLRQLVEANVPVAVHQVQYSLMDRRAAGDMVTVCGDHGVELVCYGTLAGGLLTDRYLGIEAPVEPFPNRSLRKYMLIADEFGGWPALQRLLTTARAVADRHNATVAQIAIAWVLAQPRVSSAIVGLSSWPRLEEALGGATLHLPEDDLTALTEAVQGSPGPSGPVFGLERIPGGRHARIMKYNLNRDQAPSRTGPSS